MFARFMLAAKDLKKIFSKKDKIPFRDGKLSVWGIGYWLIQPFFVGLPYGLYYRKFQVNGWENVPQDKPVIFAISHRNAFMDSLAFVNIKSTQVWQLARGDAFNNKAAEKLFYFFHMLPIWRERDGVDTKAMNDPTFDACADILAKNGQIGIYPEGNCVDEEHIRPLKKGICRIAFLAEERYDFELDVHIIPVGISYSASEKFKKWQLVNFGKPILLKGYSESYKTNPAQTINVLKDAIEMGMQQTTVHVEYSQFHQDIVEISRMVARENILKASIKYEPITKLQEEQIVSKKLENLRTENHEALETLVGDFHSYKQEITQHHFKENTFDKAKHHTLAIAFMALYFLFFLPVFIYGFIVNYLPYSIPHWYAKNKLKQKIFWSSAQYVIGLFLFPIYYLILTIIISKVLGSVFSALVFLVSFPIAGHIAFYYWYDLKKWLSVLRFKGLSASKKDQIIALRNRVINSVNN